MGMDREKLNSLLAASLTDQSRGLIITDNAI